MIDDLLGLLVNLILEVLLELAAELGVEVVGRRVFASVLGDADKVSGWWSSVGQLVLGLAAGGSTLLIVPGAVFRRGPVPGVSLLFAPAITAVLVDLLGSQWEARRGWRPALFTLRAGALFAFGMALVRFVYGAH
jgi:hypothetical protein